eukprot:g2539.t1
MAGNNRNQTIAKFCAKSPSESFDWRGKILSQTGIVSAITSFTRPKGPGTCDHNETERAANVITSLPFFLVGIQTIRKRKSSAGKLYGGSIVGVGLASTLFHGSKGRWKELSRKVDYWTCAISATCLSKAIFPKIPPFVIGVSLGLTPFCPFLVASANTLAMELEFRKRSLTNERLKSTHIRHNISCLTGVSLFYWEDKKPQIPMTHAAWHIVSSFALASTNHLLENVEQTSKPRRGICSRQY